MAARTPAAPAKPRRAPAKHTDSSADEGQQPIIPTVKVKVVTEVDSKVMYHMYYNGGSRWGSSNLMVFEVELYDFQSVGQVQQTFAISGDPFRQCPVLIPALDEDGMIERVTIVHSAHDRSSADETAEMYERHLNASALRFLPSTIQTNIVEAEDEIYVEYKLHLQPGKRFQLDGFACKQDDEVRIIWDKDNFRFIITNPKNSLYPAADLQPVAEKLEKKLKKSVSQL